jgi:hypothetical protein
MTAHAESQTLVYAPFISRRLVLGPDQAILSVRNGAVRSRGEMKPRIDFRTGRPNHGFASSDFLTSM